MNAKQFEENFTKIEAVREIVQSIPERKLEVEATREHLQELEDTEYDSQQFLNLSMLIGRQNEDFWKDVLRPRLEEAEHNYEAGTLETCAYGSDEEVDVLDDPSKPLWEQPVDVSADMLDQTTTDKYMGRKLWLEDKMHEYGVDPGWLKEKQTPHLRQLAEESQQKLQQEAKKVQEDLLGSQFETLRDVVDKQILGADKNAGPAMAAYMLNGLREIEQRSKILNDSKGQLVTQMLITNLSQGGSFLPTTDVIAEHIESKQQKTEITPPS